MINSTGSPFWGINRIKPFKLFAVRKSRTGLPPHEPNVEVQVPMVGLFTAALFEGIMINVHGLGGNEEPLIPIANLEKHMG